MSEQTERIVAAFRAGTEQYGLAANGMIVRALLDLADQRDELLAACEALIAYRDKVGPLSFQLEKADDFINAMRLAVEKARSADDKS